MKSLEGREASVTMGLFQLCTVRSSMRDCPNIQDGSIYDPHSFGPTARATRILQDMSKSIRHTYTHVFGNWTGLKFAMFLYSFLSYWPRFKKNKVTWTFTQHMFHCRFFVYENFTSYMFYETNTLKEIFWGPTLICFRHESLQDPRYLPRYSPAMAASASTFSTSFSISGLLQISSQVPLNPFFRASSMSSFWFGTTNPIT